VIGMAAKMLEDVATIDVPSVPCRSSWCPQAFAGATEYEQLQPRIVNALEQSGMFAGGYFQPVN
jgi:hypothetical protein